MVDPKTGEFVAIMTKPVLFGNKPSPSVSLIPGIVVLVSGLMMKTMALLLVVYILPNTRFDYSSDVVVELYGRIEENIPMVSLNQWWLRMG